MAIIEVESVFKSFSIPSAQRRTVREHALDLFRPQPVRELLVLAGVSLEVKQGETVGIMGRNGSGKSTLLRIVTGIYHPDRGVVTVRAPMTPILELGLGWNPALDAVDNILLLGSVLGRSLSDLKASVGEILAFAELDSFANVKLQHYSTGMAARLAYAVAFTAPREVLVLDEIFAVGDAGFKERCEGRFRGLMADGHSILIASHDPDFVAEYCDRALLLEQGRIVADGDPVQVGEEYLKLMQVDSAPRRPGASIPLADDQRGAVEFGDLRRIAPFSTVWGYDRGQPIDRHYIEAFLASHRADIAGRVLETWKDPKHATYAEQFGGAAVTKRDVLDIDPDNPCVTIVADLTQANRVASNLFDCFILTQTLHHIYDVRSAIDHACRILKPGGVLLCTLPATSRLAEDHSDYWRFTEASARHLFRDTFGDDNVHVGVRGNALACAAFLYGLAAGDLTSEELESTDDSCPLLVCVRAVKPRA